MSDKAVRRNGRPQACEPCRQAKVACDRGLPTCLRCKRRSMSLNCVYSARGAARPSQAERWAGEDILRGNGLLQPLAIDQQMVVRGDGWMPNPNLYAGIDPGLPMDHLSLQALHSDPVFGMDPSTYSGHTDPSFLMLPQTHEEQMNATLFDQQAQLLVDERGGQLKPMGGDPNMAAAYYSQLQARRVPPAQYQIPMTLGPNGGMMNGSYATMSRGGMQTPPPHGYQRRIDRR